MPSKRNNSFKSDNKNNNVVTTRSSLANQSQIESSYQIDREMNNHERHSQKITYAGLSSIVDQCQSNQTNNEKMIPYEQHSMQISGLRWCMEGCLPEKHNKESNKKNQNNNELNNKEVDIVDAVLVADSILTTEKEIVETQHNNTCDFDNTNEDKKVDSTMEEKKDDDTDNVFDCNINNGTANIDLTDQRKPSIVTENVNKTFTEKKSLCSTTVSSGEPNNQMTNQSMKISQIINNTVRTENNMHVLFDSKKQSKDNNSENTFGRVTIPICTENIGNDIKFIGNSSNLQQTKSTSSIRSFTVSDGANKDALDGLLSLRSNKKSKEKAATATSVANKQWDDVNAALDDRLFTANESKKDSQIATSKLKEESIKNNSKKEKLQRNNSDALDDGIIAANSGKKDKEPEVAKELTNKKSRTGKPARKLLDDAFLATNHGTENKEIVPSKQAQESTKKISKKERSPRNSFDTFGDSDMNDDKIANVNVNKVIRKRRSLTASDYGVLALIPGKEDKERDPSQLNQDSTKQNSKTKKPALNDSYELYNSNPSNKDKESSPTKVLKESRKRKAAGNNLDSLLLTTTPSKDDKERYALQQDRESKRKNLKIEKPALNDLDALDDGLPGKGEAEAAPLKLDRESTNEDIGKEFPPTDDFDAVVDGITEIHPDENTAAAKFAKKSIKKNLKKEKPEQNDFDHHALDAIPTTLLYKKDKESAPVKKAKKAIKTNATPSATKEKHTQNLNSSERNYGTLNETNESYRGRTSIFEAVEKKVLSDSMSATHRHDETEETMFHTEAPQDLKEAHFKNKMHSHKDCQNGFNMLKDGENKIEEQLQDRTCNVHVVDEADCIGHVAANQSRQDKFLQQIPVDEPTKTKNSKIEEPTTKNIRWRSPEKGSKKVAKMRSKEISSSFAVVNNSTKARKHKIKLIKVIPAQDVCRRSLQGALDDCEAKEHSKETKPDGFNAAESVGQVVLNHSKKDAKIIPAKSYQESIDTNFNSGKTTKDVRQSGSKIMSENESKVTEKLNGISSNCEHDPRKKFQPISISGTKVRRKSKKALESRTNSPKSTLADSGSDSDNNLVGHADSIEDSFRNSLNDVVKRANTAGSRPENTPTDNQLQTEGTLGRTSKKFAIPSEELETMQGALDENSSHGHFHENKEHFEDELEKKILYYPGTGNSSDCECSIVSTREEPHQKDDETHDVAGIHDRMEEDNEVGSDTESSNTDSFHETYPIHSKRRPQQGEKRSGDTRSRKQKNSMFDCHSDQNKISPGESILRGSFSVSDRTQISTKIGNADEKNPMYPIDPSQQNKDLVGPDRADNKVARSTSSKKSKHKRAIKNGILVKSEKNASSRHLQKPIVYAGRQGVGKFGHPEYLCRMNSLRSKYLDATAEDREVIINIVIDEFDFRTAHGVKFDRQQARTKIVKSLSDARLRCTSDNGTVLRKPTSKHLGTERDTESVLHKEKKRRSDSDLPPKRNRKKRKEDNDDISLGRKSQEKEMEIFADRSEHDRDDNSAHDVPANMENSFNDESDQSEKNVDSSSSVRHKQSVNVVPMYKKKPVSNKLKQFETSCYVEELAFHAMTGKKELLPMPNPPEPPACFPMGKLRWKYEEATRVLLVDFREADVITKEERYFFGKMLQRDDITVISEGLFSVPTDEKLFEESFLSYLETAFSGRPYYHKFRRFDRGLFDGIPTFVEKDGFLSMSVSDYLKYIDLHKKKSEEIFCYKDAMGVDKEITNPSNTVLYMIDIDMAAHSGWYYKSFKDDFKMKEICPGGDWCMMNMVPEKSRPFMGPNVYVSPGGGYTHLHQDGHGTVDSGHACLSGYNEVIMLRRLPEAHKLNACQLVPSLNQERYEYQSENICYRLPHDNGREDVLAWASVDVIEKWESLNYCPSVFVLSPGQHVHINKGRMHAFRKMSNDPLPKSDCHHHLRCAYAPKFVEAPLCISVAWDWMFLGIEAEGINREVASIMECARLCRERESSKSLAIPETCLFQMMEKLPQRVAGEKMPISMTQDDGSTYKIPVKDIAKGIMPSLEFLVKREVEINQQFTSKNYTEPVPDSDYDPATYHIDPNGNDYFCILCAQELSNSYFYCKGCANLLDMDYYICIGCYKEKKYKVNTLMNKRKDKPDKKWTSDIHHTGKSGYKKLASTDCGCKSGPCRLCVIEKNGNTGRNKCLCKKCSCECHRAFGSRKRFFRTERMITLRGGLESLTDGERVEFFEETEARVAGLVMVQPGEEIFYEVPLEAVKEDSNDEHETGIVELKDDHSSVSSSSCSDLSAVSEPEARQRVFSRPKKSKIITKVHKSSIHGDVESNGDKLIY